MESTVIRANLFAVLFVLPFTCAAETHLCVGEAGAAVEHGGPAGINAGLYDVSKARYVISNASGSWQFREVGQDTSLLVCSSEYYCEVQGGFSTFFMRERGSNVFTYVSLVVIEPDFKRKILYTVNGKCSQI